MTAIPDNLSPTRHLVTEIPGPRSLELMSRRQRAIPSGVGTTLPVFVTRAGPGILEDVDGNRLIDFGSGISTTNVGNSAPLVVAAIQEQAALFTHTCFQVTPYASYVEVCERLNELTPGSHEKRSFLVNSGAEAVENAVKVARYATGRPGIVAFDHGFHGRTLLALTLTGKVHPYKQGFGPFVPEIHRAPYSDPFRETGRLGDTITMLETTVGVESIAAVLVEPIAGEGGVVVPEPGWLAGLADWCREQGILLIADEVQTGFGRTGAWFACEHEGVVPDLITTAKSLGGGLPIGGITGRAEIMNAVHSGGLGGTFGGNPVACAAALAAIRTIESEGLLARARAIGETMMRRLRRLSAGAPAIGNVRGRGAMVGIEFVGADGIAPDRETTGRVLRRCHQDGLMVLGAGTYGNVIRLLPPLVISDGLLDEGLGILERAVTAP
ncbi:MAG: 4-aminobutyrate--2-oxoglutarate transaminase [Candidatus Dormiibacterota bacterium]|jgi:4-aminobutyrate aminotransferase/(S)-3-amino-2-methylpropionate transaminase